MSMENKSHNFTGSVDASGGKGGKGGDGYGGGRGGDGGDGGSAGSVHFIQIGKEFTPEGITIQDIKNPNKQYWLMIFKRICGWFRDHVLVTIIVGLILAYAIHWLGLN